MALLGFTTLFQALLGSPWLYYTLPWLYYILRWLYVTLHDPTTFYRGSNSLYFALLHSTLLNYILPWLYYTFHNGPTSLYMTYYILPGF